MHGGKIGQHIAFAEVLTLPRALPITAAYNVFPYPISHFPFPLTLHSYAYVYVLTHQLRGDRCWTWAGSYLAKTRGLIGAHTSMTCTASSSTG
jgi:hypothetical protein